jgi:hypothetical protein
MYTYIYIFHTRQIYCFLIFVTQISLGIDTFYAVAGIQTQKGVEDAVKRFLPLIVQEEIIPYVEQQTWPDVNYHIGGCHNAYNIWGSRATNKKIVLAPGKVVTIYPQSCGSIESPDRK